MIFRVDRNTGLTDYLNGKNYISIACDCWFTASGEIHPRFFKVQEDGDVITVPIKVIHSQQLLLGVCSRHAGTQLQCRNLIRTSTLTRVQ